MTARPEGAARTSRTIDLPVSIVWDALVDPVLVEGWLHPSLQLLDGVVHEREDETVLDTESAGLGRIRITMAAVPGGTRGSSTAIEVTASGGTAAPRQTADWETRLDRLEDLLRGHPVDWTALAAESARAARSAR